MIVEPCCAAKQLPKVMLGDERFFQTSGDVLITKFIDAVAPVFKSRSTELLLVCPRVNREVLMQISSYIDREYIGKATILTRSESESSDDTNSVNRAKTGENGTGTGENGNKSPENGTKTAENCKLSNQGIVTVPEMTLAEDPMVIDGMLAFTHGRYGCIIQGAMLTEVDLSMSLYSCYYGEDNNIINTAMAPLLSRVHLAQKRR